MLFPQCTPPAPATKELRPKVSGSPGPLSPASHPSAHLNSKFRVDPTHQIRLSSPCHGHLLPGHGHLLPGLLRQLPDWSHFFCLRPWSIHPSVCFRYSPHDANETEVRACCSVLRILQQFSSGWDETPPSSQGWPGPWSGSQVPLWALGPLPHGHCPGPRAVW